MKIVLMAVRDQKANDFTPPVPQPNRAIAHRSWQNELNDPKNADLPQCRNPEDFSLWLVGEYETNTGVITPMPPEQIAVASDLKR